MPKLLGAFSFDLFDEGIDYCAFRGFVVGHSRITTYNNTHYLYIHTHTGSHSPLYTTTRDSLLEEGRKKEGRDIRFYLDTYTLWPHIVVYMRQGRCWSLS